MINKHAKSQGGIICVSRNLSSYYMWRTTKHARGLYHHAALERTDMGDHDSQDLKDLRCSQVTHRDVMQAVQNFVNFFEVENKNEFYCLFSGTLAPKEVENDLTGADKTGKLAYMGFVRKRLLERRVNFYDSTKKLKLKIFTKIAKTVKVASKSKKTKHIIAEWNVFSQLVMIAI
jgi:hypothetical protein